LTEHAPEGAFATTKMDGALTCAWATAESSPKTARIVFKRTSLLPFRYEDPRDIPLLATQQVFSDYNFSSYPLIVA
jgi:hypothetical protein